MIIAHSEYVWRNILLKIFQKAQASQLSLFLSRKHILQTVISVHTFQENLFLCHEVKFRGIFLYLTYTMCCVWCVYCTVCLLWCCINSCILYWFCCERCIFYTVFTAMHCSVFSVMYVLYSICCVYCRICCVSCVFRTEDAGLFLRSS